MYISKAPPHAVPPGLRGITFEGQPKGFGEQEDALEAGFSSMGLPGSMTVSHIMKTTHMQDTAGFRDERRQPYSQGPFHS